MSTRVRQHGFSLVEVLIVCGILVAIGFAVLAHWRLVEQQREVSLRTAFASALDRAHAVARASNNGATIVGVVADATQQGNGRYFVLYVCTGRPVAAGDVTGCVAAGRMGVNSSSSQTAITIVSNGDDEEDQATYAPPWALYINPDGSADVGAWNSSAAATVAGTAAAQSAPTPCSNDSTLSVLYTWAGSTASPQTDVVSDSVDCATGELLQ